MKYKKLCVGAVLLVMMYMFFMYMSNIRSVWQGFYNIESSVSASVPFKDYIHRLYGYTGKYLTPYMIDRITKDNDGYLQLRRTYTSNLDFSVRSIGKLRDVCKEADTDFLYVSYPNKADYTHYAQTVFDRYHNYGLEDNSIDLRTEFLERLNEEGIKVYNLRSFFIDDPHDIFYKTDHHWTVDSGFKAAQMISDYLNENDYDVDNSVLDLDNFERQVYKNKWLGETGRKYTEIWTGTLDDYVVIKPKFKTDLKYSLSDEYNRSGDFSILIDDAVIDTDFNLYDTSLHYCYMPDIQKYAKIINNNNKDKAKILMVVDSFSHPVAPFISLTCGEVVWWDVRENPESLFEYIRNNDFDLVITAYTDYWLNMVYDYH